ncbi:MAG: hypothetical protein ABI460_17155 [Caldimonas sp.]
MAETTKRMKDGWTILFLFGGFSVICLAIGAYMMRLQGGAAELQEANPGWKVSGDGYSPIHLDDATPAGEVLIGGDDAGPFLVERIECDEVRKVFPAWFQLPDAPIGNCARLGNAAPYTLVLNMRTDIAAQELWERLYEPTADRLHLGYSGGSSSRMPKGTAPSAAASESARYHSAMSVSIDPAPDSNDRQLAIQADSYHGSTRVIFTFRPWSPP